MERRKNRCAPARVLDPNGQPGPECPCRAAVIRAYGEMLKSEVPEGVALQAARRVYRYHHPEVSDEEAAETVEAWVFRGVPH